jgi:hypothetical protein
VEQQWRSSRQGGAARIHNSVLAAREEEGVVRWLHGWCGLPEGAEEEHSSEVEKKIKGKRRR